jgi:3-hydroxyisobutyrate dehydrogenase
MAAAPEKVALIGFGEVGQIFARDLNAHGIRDIKAFDIAFDDADSAPSRALKGGGVQACKSAVELARNAELVISAVTAASTLAAARSLLPGLKRGSFVLDLNSASPGVKREAAKAVDGAAGRYVEAAVMTSVPPHGIRSPMLLGGPHVDDFLAATKSLGFKATKYSDTVGAASATKMCRSIIVKGFEAIVAESMLTARRYGVEKDVLASLTDLFPHPNWPELARYVIARAIEHGKRRAEEMREAARTAKEVGVEPLMSLPTAARQDWAFAQKAKLPQSVKSYTELSAFLDALTKTER